jgi:hypothetical protein
LLDANQRLDSFSVHGNSILCRGSFVFVGNAAFGLGRGSFLSAFEASNPNHLVELGRYPFESGGGVHSAAMTGNRLFLAGVDKWEIVEMLPADEPPVVLRGIGRALTVAGAPARLEVHATGQENLWYQWFREGQELAGRTNAALVIPSLSAADAGAYSVRIGNSIGTVESSGTLGLAEPPPFTPQIAFSPAPMLSVKLPEGMLCSVEASGDLETWQTIWTGKAGANEIQISLEALDAQFFRLRYGNE